MIFSSTELLVDKMFGKGENAMFKKDCKECEDVKEILKSEGIWEEGVSSIKSALLCLLMRLDEQDERLAKLYIKNVILERKMSEGK